MREAIDNLNKPLHSLGMLETLAEQICMAQHTLQPELCKPAHLLFGADHGIEREGVSFSPREITWQQMINFTRGGGGVNMFCKQHGFSLRIIDVGVDHDLSSYTRIINKKVMPHGTDNFLYGPAMSEEEFEQALNVGIEMADECYREGTNILSIGEMGIGNTSPSSIWMHLLTGIPLYQCIGAGSGLSDAGIKHKSDVLHEAVRKFLETEVPQQENDSSLSALHSTLYIARYFGGLEMIAAMGAMLRAAELKMIILVDGFIMTACMAMAMRIAPAISHYAIFTHQGDESGHAMWLKALGARPILSLGLRLGEGTGALCAFPIIDSAVRMMREMNTFEEGEITKYF